MSILKRELLIYFVTLLGLATIWHNATLPEKVIMIFSSDRPFHPLEWGMTGYLALWIPRGVYIGIKKILNKMRNSDTTSN